MSQTYRAVQWNPQKRRYDLVLAAAVLLALASFVGVGALLRPNLTIETLLIRALGATAFLLLHVILAIGPLCRLESRFLPLLYNRRHLGVCMAGLALAHGGFSLLQFHALGDIDPFVSVLVADPPVLVAGAGRIELPFQIFGLAALAILVLMAATSHDFWLANLSPRLWKTLHMSVYAAYGLLVAHVAFGVLQSEASPVYPILLGLGMALLAGLHVSAARRERVSDRGMSASRTPSTAARLGDAGARPQDDFVFACSLDAIREGRARVVRVGEERVAIFRHAGRLSAVTNVCAHQNGPLGEGQIRDGCITCPWHGFQYEPATGRAPAPFIERIATYDLRLAGREVLVRRVPNPPGTPVEPLAIPASVSAPASRPAPDSDPATARTRGGDGATESAADDALYVGFDPAPPPRIARYLRPRVALLVVFAPVLLGVLAAAQDEGLPSLFEFGREREFVGWIGEHPVPTLSILRPGDPGTRGAASIHPLVGPGKHGAATIVAGFDGEQVRLRGTLFHLDGEAWIELSHAPLVRVAELAAARPDRARRSLGRHRLVGEIVDSKCHFGVMNPGSGKVHRACAMRCIEGGIPPALRIDGRDGERAALLLVDASGRGVGRAVVPYVGRPVALEGEVFRLDDLLVFAIDPDRIEAAGR